MKIKVYYEESQIRNNDYFSIRLAHRDNKAPWLINQHYSNSVEIIVYQNISATLFLGDESVALTNNSILMLPPYTAHGFEVAKGQHDYYIIHLIADDASSLFEDLIFPDTPKLLQVEGTSTSFVHELLSQAVAHPNGKIKEQALSLFLYWLNDLSDNKNKVLLTPTNSNRFIKLLKHLDQSSLYNLSADDAAKLCNISKSHFFALFKAHFNKSYNEFMITRQISQAKYLLTTTDLSITDIAQALAFCDASYFTKVFKSQVGNTPIVFRKTHQYSEHS